MRYVVYGIKDCVAWCVVWGLADEFVEFSRAIGVLFLFLAVEI